jgi:hypothetical protein
MRLCHYMIKKRDRCQPNMSERIRFDSIRQNLYSIRFDSSELIFDSIRFVRTYIRFDSIRLLKKNLDSDSIRFDRISIRIRFNSPEPNRIESNYSTIRFGFALCYGADTWRLLNRLKNHRNELSDAALSTIACTLYYSMR